MNENISRQPGTSFAWNFQRAGGQSAYEAAQNALNAKRAADYVTNMEDTQVGNAQDMMSWIQQGNEAAQYQADQAAKAQAAEARRAEQINAIEAEIEQIQARIAQNQAKLKNFTGSAGKIAALEAQKINSQDPTMIWRWQKQREDTARANNSIDTSDAKKFQNTVDMLVSQRASKTEAGIENQIRNIETAIRDGKNLGADATALKALQKRKEELEDEIYTDDSTSGKSDTGDFKTGTSQERFKAMVKDYLKDSHSSSDLKKFYEENKGQMDSDTVSTFRDAIRAKEKAERDKYEADLVRYIKERNSKYDMLTEEAKKRLRAEAIKKRGY
jgi:hypothetical protein